MEQVHSRQVIALAAARAAADYAEAPEGTPPPANPYPPLSEAAAAWRAAFSRCMNMARNPDAESSA